MTTFGIKIIGFDFIQLQYIKITTVYLLGVLSICDNFWYQNHTLLSAKKVEKKLDHLWHLLGSKSNLIIGQKSKDNAQFYRQVLRKIRVSGGFWD